MRHFTPNAYFFFKQKFGCAGRNVTAVISCVVYFRKCRLVHVKRSLLRPRNFYMLGRVLNNCAFLMKKHTFARLLFEPSAPTCHHKLPWRNITKITFTAFCFSLRRLSFSTLQRFFSKFELARRGWLRASRSRTKLTAKHFSARGETLRARGGSSRGTLRDWPASLGQ